MSAEPRILICRLSAIGDCITTLPMLCALRDHFPRAHLAWVVEPAAGALLEGHSCLDELIVVPRGYLNQPGMVWDLRRRLRGQRFDIAVDPQCLTKSAVLGWLSGAPRRIGLRGRFARELSTWLNNELWAPEAAHVVDRSLEMLRPLGVTAPEVRFDVPIDEAASRTVRAFLTTFPGAHRYLVVNPGAGWESKRWPVERYGPLAARLARQYGTRAVVIWGSERERGYAEQIVHQSEGTVVLAPRFSLKELAALLRASCLYIGSDTGPTHLAAAVNTPCVAMFGPSLPSEAGPFGMHHVCLQQYYQAGTSRERRRADNHAMRAITLEMVYRASSRLLANTLRASSVSQVA